MHLGNFLLGIQSFQCWTGPEMIVPPLVLTVKNQEMVYNPKITRKQHKHVTSHLNVGYPINNGKEFPKCSFVLPFKYIKLYREHKIWNRSEEKRNLAFTEGQISLIP